MARTIKTTLELGGESAYKKGLQSVDRALKAMSEELKDATTRFSENAKSQYNATSVMESYKKLVEQQQVKVDSLREAVEHCKKKHEEATKAYEKAAEEHGANSVEALKAADSLVKAEKSLDDYSSKLKSANKYLDSTTAEMNKFEKELKNTDSALDSVEKSLDDVTGEAKKYGKSLSNTITTSETFQKMNQTVKSGVKSVGSAIASATKVIATYTAAFTAAAGVAGAWAVKTGAAFDSQMSAVAAISGATGKDLERLRDKAKEMGETTSFSATESAQALEYMAMAGWKTDDMVDGLSGVINLAAASGENLASVSDIVTDAMTAFGMSAEESTHFADVLAKASSSANTNVSMMGETFKYVAPLAGTLGYSVEDMSIGIGLMANAGIKGSQAGTSLKTALSNMAKPTDKQAAAMDNLGISLENANGGTKSFMEVMENLRSSIGGVDVELVDSEGNLREYDDIIADLSKSTEGLSKVQQIQAASTIFGKESMSGMLAIINSSEEDFNKLTESIYNADGAAKGMSEIKLDNLAGDVTYFKSALEGVGICISEKVSPMLRDVVEKATNVMPEIQRKITDVLDNVMPYFEKFVGYLMNNLIPTFSKIGGYVAKELAPILGDIGKSVIPVIKNAIESVKKIIEQLVPVIKGIWEFVKPVFKIVVDTIDLIVGYLPTLLQDVLDFIDPLNLIHKETSQVSEEYLKMSDNADKMSKKLDDLKQKNADIGQSVLEEYNHYGDLADRLSTVVDKNGKIKEHCEYTVQQIIDELNPALDASLEIVDGQLKGYKDIADEIDNIILKKQAESMLEKGQENYDQAVADLSKATQARVAAESEINELEKELDDLHAKRKEWDETGIVPEGFDPSGYCGDIQRLEENINHLNGTVETETQNINKANNEITKYSGLQTAALEGNIGAMQRYAAEYSNSMLTAGNATITELTEQNDKFSEIYDNLVEAKKNGDTSVTDEMIDTYTRLRNISHDELAEAQRMANEQGVAAAEKFGKGLESSTGFVTVAARTVAESAEKELDKDTTSHGANFAWGFSEGMRSQIDSAISAAREVGNAAAAALHNALDEHSPSRVTRKIGRFFGIGFSKGISDEESNTIKTTQRYASSAVNALGFGIKSQKLNAAINADISSFSSQKNHSSSSEKSNSGITVIIDKVEIHNDDDIEDTAYKLALKVKQAEMALGV